MATEESSYQRGKSLTTEGLFELVTDEVYRDGKLDPNEQRILQGLAKKLGLAEARAQALTERSLGRYKAGQLGAERPFEAHRLYARTLRYVLSDGKVDPVEKLLVEGLFKIFRLSPEDHKRILEEVKRDPGATENTLPARPRKEAPQPAVLPAPAPPAPAPPAAAQPATVPPAPVKPASAKRAAAPPDATPRSNQQTKPAAARAPSAEVRGFNPSLWILGVILIPVGLIGPFVSLMAQNGITWGLFLAVPVGAAALMVEKQSYVTLSSTGLTVHTPWSHAEMAWATMRTLARGVTLVYQNGSFSEARVRITVKGTNGQTIDFLRRENSKEPGPFRELYLEMLKYLGPRLMEEDLKEFAQKGELSFGTLIVSRIGLRFPAGWIFREEKLVEWKQIKQVWIKDGTLKFVALNTLFADFSCSVDELPNTFTLYELFAKHGHPIDQPRAVG